jgi:hypothetical protein
MWHSALQKLWRCFVLGEVTKSQLMAVIETMDDKFQQVLERFSVHSKEIYALKTELKEDIALVDANVMGLSRRADALKNI